MVTIVCFSAKIKGNQPAHCAPDKARWKEEQLLGKSGPYPNHWCQFPSLAPGQQASLASSRLKIFGEKPGGRPVFLNPAGPSWAALTPGAAGLLSRLDGTQSVADLAGFSAGSTLVPRLLEVFERLGLLQGPESAASPVPELIPLRYAALYLTRACNLACKFCFFSAGKAYKDEMTTGDYYRLLDDMSAMGVGSVYLMGGEPLMRRDVFAIASRARSLGMACLVTNGTLLTEARADKVLENFTFVQVSVDGLQEEHDRFRGPGTFERTVQGILPDGAYKKVEPDGAEMLAAQMQLVDKYGH